MPDRRGPPVISLELPGHPTDPFDRLIEELTGALARSGRTLVPGRRGRLLSGEGAIATVREWRPGRSFRLEWTRTPHSAGRTGLSLRIERTGGGTLIRLTPTGPFLRGESEEISGWVVRELLAPALLALAPARQDDWLLERRTRRPSGPAARATYRDPIYHRPNFLAILDELRLSSADELLEVGCGGGAFLAEALRSGCRAAAVDHSPEMVALAREVNAAAVAEGRAAIVESDATRLPFRAGRFSVAVSTGVLGFLPDPVAVFREIRRVLRPGGRLVLFTGSAKLRGTPAAPEPFASRLRFYTDAELERMARAAGFQQARVRHPNLGRFAAKVGVPEEAMPLFRMPRAGQLLLARAPDRRGGRPRRAPPRGR